MRSRWHKVSVVLGVTFGTLLACQERLVGDEIEGHRWCAPVTSAFVYDDEGNKVAAILDEEGGSIFVCRCITDEDGLDGIYDEEVNDEALDLCLYHAERLGYPGPENNNCDELHAMNHWGEGFGILPEDRGEICDLGEDGAPVGCSAQ